MDQDELTGWASMAAPTAERTAKGLIRNADILEKDNEEEEEGGFAKAPWQADARTGM